MLTADVASGTKLRPRLVRCPGGFVDALAARRPGDGVCAGYAARPAGPRIHGSRNWLRRWTPTQSSSPAIRASVCDRSRDRPGFTARVRAECRGGIAIPRPILRPGHFIERHRAPDEPPEGDGGSAAGAAAGWIRRAYRALPRVEIHQPRPEPGRLPHASGGEVAGPAKSAEGRSGGRPSFYRPSPRVSPRALAMVSAPHSRNISLPPRRVPLVWP